MSDLERLIREALSQGDLEDCKDELLGLRGDVIQHLEATYPHLDGEVLEAIWDSGMDCLLELIEVEVSDGN